GTFQDVSQKSGIANKKGRALGVAFADYNADGFTDVFVANDGMQQYLYRNNGDETFTECALESGAALSADGKPLSGMGTVFQDYDNDGKPDIFVTVLPREIYGAYHNDGEGLFTSRNLETGLGALSSGSSGWGVGLEDFDNDGWKDLFVAQSHVLDNVEKIDPSLHYLEPPMFALNHNGRFERADLGTVVPVAGRGAAFGERQAPSFRTRGGGNCSGRDPVALRYTADVEQYSRRSVSRSARTREAMTVKLLIRCWLRITKS